MKYFFLSVVPVAAMLLLAGSVSSETLTVYTVVIKDHRFDPEELAVPAGEKFELVVVNQDSRWKSLKVMT